MSHALELKSLSGAALLTKIKEWTSLFSQKGSLVSTSRYNDKGADVIGPTAGTLLLSGDERTARKTCLLQGVAPYWGRNAPTGHLGTHCLRSEGRAEYLQGTPVNVAAWHTEAPHLLSGCPKK